MWKADEKEFMKPHSKYRMKLMQHSWEADTAEKMMDAFCELGFGGAVTNPNWNHKEKSTEQLAEEFSGMLDKLEEKDLSFWIYDEKGYPSGHAGGEVLKGHKEYEAKGFYMIKRVCYPSNGTKKGVFHIDEETDKIIWAAKYPLIIDAVHDNYIDHKNMTPVSFTSDECEYSLEEGEILTIFCVKPAYEGSHCTHNVSSFLRYINVMDKNAVKRFIDIQYEPLAKYIPDVYKRAEAVFTDEPSLQHTYRRDYETWGYALCPWVEGLFDRFEDEYGYSIIPYLPMLFEGRSQWFYEIYALKAQFYRLVGKLVAEAFTGQISQWLKDHGGIFSGHYIGEENLSQHVEFYGDFIEVIKKTGYPGVDNLWCVPEIYHYNTAKFAQIAVRKNNTNGMMVEMCPFQQRDRFYKDARDNFCAIIDMMYMSGVRKVNSYARPDFSEYDKTLPKEAPAMSVKDTLYVNNYIARMGYMLDNVSNYCDTFVYYNIENSQAKMVPSHTPLTGDICEADEANTKVISRVLEEGFDFYYADREDLLSAVESLGTGDVLISGCKVKTVIVPKCDVIYSDSYNALKTLSDKGVKVIFVDKVPEVCIDQRSLSFEKADDAFIALSLDETVGYLKKAEDDFKVYAPGITLMKAKYIKDGSEMYFIHNNTRGKDAVVTFKHSKYKVAKVYNVSDGSVTDVEARESFKLPYYRGIFVVF